MQGGAHSTLRITVRADLSRNKNLRALQPMVGQPKIQRAVRYLGFEVDDALEKAGQTNVLEFCTTCERRDRWGEAAPVSFFH